MASSLAKASSVRYDTPQDWAKFGPSFVLQAQSYGVWQYIDPKDRTPWPTQPEEPSLSTYPKRLVRRDTRGSTSTATASPALEEIDFTSTPQSFTELTEEGFSRYKFAYQLYESKQRAFELHRTKVSKFRTWILENISETIQVSCCHKDKEIDEWYAAFERVGAPYEQLQLDYLQTRYDAATKPLTRIPKDFNKWVNDWRETMVDGQRIGLPEVLMARTWFKHLVRALNLVLST